jgi:hypothetical protein
MVGNDVQRDLAPAHRLGLSTYHVVDSSRSGPADVVAEASNGDRRGDLFDLRSWLESADFSALEPTLRARESILAIMASTPGVLRGLLSELAGDEWSRRPAPDDWAAIEVVSHLRDTEREVHHMQIKTLLEQTKPFIPRPDAAVWARQRKYLNEDGAAALAAFTSARIESLNQLDALSETAWRRVARHAIFGPTDSTEVVGFMADHDRMHIQQAWNILRAL